MPLSCETNIGILKKNDTIRLLPFSDIRIPETMSQTVSLKKVLEKNPQLKERLDKYLSSVLPEQREADFEKFKKFIEGEMTWAEVSSIPKALLKEITQIAYLKFKMAEYAVAETLFKGLAIIDHNNWYYRSALGAIYQKQKLFDQAIDEYSVSLMFQEQELSTLVNRGECYYSLGKMDEARKDFEKALELDKSQTNRWAKRAHALLSKTNKDQGMPVRN